MEITIFTLIVLLFSVMIHEIAHGSVANFLGDSTAKNSGRLTLNPLKHLDPFGSVILPLLLLLVTAGRGPIFGWAKPVPVNNYNLRDQKWGMLKVAISGPLINFIIAILFGLILRFFVLPQQIFIFFSIISMYNFLWGIFNLVPIPPLDGSWIIFTFLAERLSGFKNFFQRYSFIILLFIIFFGLDWLASAANFLFHLISGYSLMI